MTWPEAAVFIALIAASTVLGRVVIAELSKRFS